MDVRLLSKSAVSTFEIKEAADVAGVTGLKEALIVPVVVATLLVLFNDGGVDVFIILEVEMVGEGVECDNGEFCRVGNALVNAGPAAAATT